MTAEIAILNRAAVALAADSAVTISAVNGNGRTEKVYKTANKLFALSKHHPVGIMIYGNAALLGIPWETVIKAFRRELGRSEYDYLEQYADAFWTYLADNAPKLFPLQQQQNWVRAICYACFGGIRDEINARLEDDIRDRGHITELAIKRIATSIIEEHGESWEKKPWLPGFDEQFRRKLLRAYRAIIDEAKKKIFGRFPLSARANSLLNQIIGDLVFRDVFGSGHSGIVVAGFGKEEIFPAMRCYVVDGVALDRVIYKINQSYDVAFDNGAMIAPFAQDDMVYLFMEGTDRDYRRFKLKFLQDIFSTLPEHIVAAAKNMTDGDKATWKSDLERVLTGLYDSFVDDMDRYRRENYVAPIMSVVNLMPKDELAVMAETLVNLTAFKRKINMVTETVGEPVDVAVITKGDGLVWIKRKQYFDPAINHAFLSNYID